MYIQRTATATSGLLDTLKSAGGAALDIFKSGLTGGGTTVVKQETDYTPFIIGGGVLLVAVLLLTRKK